jgi:VanZ family protein
MQTFKYYWPALGWWCITLYLFTLPGTAFPSQNWMDELPVDKAAHLILFAIMVLLFYRGWRQQTANQNKKAGMYGWYLVPALALLYGIAIELVQQQWIPNRSFEGMDIVADAAGCMLGFFWGRRTWKKEGAGA